MKKLASILLAIAVAATSWAAAAIDYDAVSTKAERFFNYQEWNSALAMYELMIDSRPLDIPTYYKAIVASGMLGRKDIQIDMLSRTQKQGIALDSIFSGVKKVSFAIGEGEAYEEFLKLVRERQPWIARGINTYLLEYYNFRNDAVNMIDVAERLLTTTPDNVEYIRILARGYMMAGRMDDAVECYKHIASQNPADYDAHLNLGIFYKQRLETAAPADQADCAALAQTYLTDAYRLQPTPYVAQLLVDLRKRVK